MCLMWLRLEDPRPEGTSFVRNGETISQGYNKILYKIQQPDLSVVWEKGWGLMRAWESWRDHWPKVLQSIAWDLEEVLLGSGVWASACLPSGDI